MSAVRFVANLDCEMTWTAAVAAARDPSVRVPPPPARLLARLSALGTLLGALTRPGDRLWTPLPVDPERVRPGPGGTRPSAESGPLAGVADVPGVGRVVAWGETTEVVALRRDAGDPAQTGGWLEVLRAALPSPPAVAMRANDRALAAALRTLPGAGWVASPEELAEHVAAGGADESPSGRWVLKAPLSAAGRGRLRGSGTDLPPGDRVRLERLLERHGRLRFEPWMERSADFGAVGIVEPSGRVRCVGRHELDMAGGGALRSVRPLAAGDSALSAAEREALAGAVQSVGGALLELGYQGPFGVDAFRYVDGNAEPRFHALCEINARLTFGFVAHALADAAGWDPSGEARAPALHVGTRRGLERAGDAAYPLLLPGEDDPVAAWLR